MDEERKSWPVTPQDVLASIRPLSRERAREMREQAAADMDQAVQQVQAQMQTHPTLPLYKCLARELWRYQNCVGNLVVSLVADEAHEQITRLVSQYMPSGSGFDSGTELDFDKSTPNKLVFNTSFHHMNEHGYYTRWTEHQVVATPCFCFDFSLRVTGRDHNGIKDYIYETFQHALTSRVPASGVSVMDVA